MHESPGHSTILGRIADDFLQRVERGEQPAVDDYIQRHPELADVLREILPLLDLPTSTSPTTPQMVAGYEIIGELGRGGMGVVYHARQIALNRAVALKVIRGAELAGATERQRFLAEAEAAARLRHPGIVQVFEYGETPAGPYFSLEYIANGTLAQRLAGEPQPPREAAQLVRSLADAVQHAHDAGVIHRDLKPANVLMDDVPKITDFGLARTVDSTLTASDAIVGTPSYMAPEQASGMAVDSRCDVWALGAILYECLTGRPPFRGASVLETLEQVRHREPVAPSSLVDGVPRDLETICLKCLDKEPLRRYQTAQALEEDLRRYLEGRTVTARPVGAFRRGWRWCRRNPVIAGLLTGVMGLLVVIAVGSVIVALDRDQNLTRILSAESQTREQRDAAILNLDRALKAEDDLEERLWRSLVDQAAIQQVSGQIGHRFVSLQLLKEAASLARKRHRGTESLLPLRDHAIAAMLRPDARMVYEGGIPWPDKISRTAFSADLERVVQVQENGEVLVRRIRDGQEVVRCAATEPLDDVQISPDNRWIVGRTRRDGVQVWNLGTGRRDNAFPENCESRCFLFSPDGRTLGLCVKGMDYVEYDTMNWNVVRRFPIETKVYPQQMAISATGKRLAVATPSWLQIYDTSTGSKLYSLSLVSRLQALAWDGSGDQLVYSQNGVIFLLDPVSGVRRNTVVLPSKQQITQIAFLQDGRHFLTWSTNQSLLLWDKVTMQYRRFMEGTRWLATGTHNRLLANGTQLDRIGVWELAIGDERELLPVNPRMGYLSSDGEWNVEPGQGFIISSMRDLKNRRLLPIPDQIPIATDPKQTTLITAGEFGTYLWPIQRGVDWRIGPPLRLPVSIFNPKAVVFDGSSQRLAISTGSTISVWDRTRQRFQFGPQSHDLAADPKAIALHPEEPLLAVPSRNGITVWNIESGKNIAQLKTDYYVHKLAFSPDGRWLVANDHGTITQWRTGAWNTPIRRWQRLDTLIGPRSVCFAKDGTLLAIDIGSHTILLVHPESGERLGTIELGADARVQDLRFTAATDAMLVASDSYWIRWDLRKIRSQLREIGLDWDNQFPDELVKDAFPQRLALDLGGFRPGGPTQMMFQRAAKELSKQEAMLLSRLKQNPTATPTSEWYFDNAMAYTIREDFESALGTIEVAIALLPSELYQAIEAGKIADVLKLVAKLRLYVGRRGQFLLELGRFEEAIENLLLAEVAGNPEPSVLVAIARIRANGPTALRDPENALSLMERIGGEATKSIHDCVVLAMTLYRAGRWQEARDKLSELVKLATFVDYARVVHLLALTEHRLQRDADSRRWQQEGERWLATNRLALRSSQLAEIEMLQEELRDSIHLPPPEKLPAPSSR